MINDSIKATGALCVILKDEHGNIKYENTMKNLVVTVGKALIASRLAGDTPLARPDIMAIGTGTVGAVTGDTNLGTEVARVVCTSVTPAANTITYSATFAPGVATAALTEAGLFTGTTTPGNGTLLSRTVFLPVNKNSGDTLVINWQITIN